ncbi:MAG: hypothetical protein ACTHWO_11205 [Nesterenkonia sp.]
MSHSYSTHKDEVEAARKTDGKFGSYQAGESGASLTAAVDALSHTHQQDPAPVSQEDFGDFRTGIAAAMKDDLTQSYNDGMYSDEGEPPEEQIEELEFGEDTSGKLDELSEDFMSNNYADLKQFAQATEQDLADVGADAYLSGAGTGVSFTDRIPDDRAVASMQLNTLRNTTGDEFFRHVEKVRETIDHSGVEPVNRPDGKIRLDATLAKIADGDAPSVKAYEAAQRLDEAATESFGAAFENAEIGDDGKLHLWG